MTTTSPDPHMDRALRALEGLSVGDAFGERFFGPHDAILARIHAREVTDGPWRWSDDTAMALAVTQCLGPTLDQDLLGFELLLRYAREPWRGYGGGAHRLFSDMASGTSWEVASCDLFQGQGSFGNGAAMRIAPLGAYFAHDLDVLTTQALRSAEVTHAHPDGQAGAVAIAIATAMAWRTRALDPVLAGEDLFQEVLTRTPESHTLERLRISANVPLSASVPHAVHRLGNGSKISSQDTVPLCVWMIRRHLRDYEEAMWQTVSALGDRDTTCAIVGGAVRMSAPDSTFPTTWLSNREPLEGLPPAPTNA